MNGSFTLAATGQSLIKHDTRVSRDDDFEAVRTLLQGADVAFTNFESTINGRHGGWPLKGSYFGSSEPGVLDALKHLGFNALALSNNHAFDLGPSGVLSTLEEVTERGFLHAGIGRNHDDAARTNVSVINGRGVGLTAMDGGPGPDFMYAANAAPGRPERPGINRLRVSQVIEVDDTMFEHLCEVRGKVGYSAVDLANDSQPDDPRSDRPDEVGIARAVFRRSSQFGRSVQIEESDVARNMRSIETAASDGTMVIAYLHHHHWAADWNAVPAWVTNVARQCIDAGAVMFVSHGAPVLQPLEIYRNRPIFYSLGNFIFHVRSEETTWFAPEVWESVVALCSFDKNRELTDLALHPIVIGGNAALDRSPLERRLVPNLASGNTADRILGRLKDESARYGTVIEIADGQGLVRL